MVTSIHQTMGSPVGYQQRCTMSCCPRMMMKTGMEMEGTVRTEMETGVEEEVAVLGNNQGNQVEVAVHLMAFHVHGNFLLLVTVGPLVLMDWSAS